MNDNSLSGKAVPCNVSSSSSAEFSWANLILDVEQDMEREDDQECSIYQQQRQLELEQELHALINVGPNHHDDIINIEAGRSTSNETTSMFLDWFKKNKDKITAEDLRRIKLKKSTVECATRRLGGGQVGMRKLLDLILQWVEINHNNRRRAREVLAPSPLPSQFDEQQQQNLTTNFIESSLISGPIQPVYPNSFPFQSHQWTPPELQPQPEFIAGGGYIGHDTYNNAFGDGINHPHFQTPNQPFPILESSMQPDVMCVPQPSHLPQPHAFSSSGIQATSSAPSVTKEARRRRMEIYQRVLPPFRHNNQQLQRRSHGQGSSARASETQHPDLSRR